MDKYEEEAAELVEHCRYCGMPDYRPKCKADYEDSVKAVATKLREKDAEYKRIEADAQLYASWYLEANNEIAQLKTESEQRGNLVDKLTFLVNDLRKEINELKAQLAEREAENVHNVRYGHDKNIECEELRKSLAEAVKLFRTVIVPPQEWSYGDITRWLAAQDKNR